jgi:hypothetical protein
MQLAGARPVRNNCHKQNLAVMSSCAKPSPEGALRGFAGTSTIRVFLFRPRSRAGLPRQPFRGGAYGIRKTENRY